MASTKHLAGLVVIEIGHSVAAPFAGLILSELGAEVLKVENPKGGDHARGWGPPFWEGTASAFHAALQDVAQVAAHPQTEALGILQSRDAGGLRLVGLPVSFDGERPDLEWPVPRLGEHNDMLDKAE